jgi:hypothetical protein
MRMNNTALTNNLSNFAQSGQTHATIQVMAYNSDGSSTVEHYELQRLAAGGFKVTDNNGNVPIERTFESTNKAEAWVQSMTNSTITQ